MEQISIETAQPLTFIDFCQSRTAKQMTVYSALELYKEYINVSNTHGYSVFIEAVRIYDTDSMLSACIYLKGISTLTLSRVIIEALKESIDRHTPNTVN